MASNYGDPASQSNPDEVVATHASMVLDVDFDDMIIQGSIEYTAEIKVFDDVGGAGGGGGDVPRDIFASGRERD